LVDQSPDGALFECGTLPSSSTDSASGNVGEGGFRRVGLWPGLPAPPARATASTCSPLAAPRCGPPARRCRGLPAGPAPARELQAKASAKRPGKTAGVASTRKHAVQLFTSSYLPRAAFHSTARRLQTSFRCTSPAAPTISRAGRLIDSPCGGWSSCRARRAAASSATPSRGPRPRPLAGDRRAASSSAPSR
jgi:hypothetical protein